jgi:hypothetical protein
LPLDLVQDGTALLAQHFLKDAATSIDCFKGVTFPLKRLVADNEEFSYGSLSVQSPFRNVPELLSMWWRWLRI